MPFYPKSAMTLAASATDRNSRPNFATTTLALPLPATVRLGTVVGRLESQQFVESIDVGIADRRGVCRSRCGRRTWIC